MNRARARRSGLVAAALLVVTVVVAGFTLPAEVDGWYTPSSTPDWTYPRWLDLAVRAGGVVVLSLMVYILGGMFESLADAFGRSGDGEPHGGRELGVTVVVLYAVCQIWLIVFLGNNKDRAWFELLLLGIGTTTMFALLGRGFFRMMGEENPDVT